MSELLAYNPDKPVSLPGARCAYCGCVIGGRATTSDHVVARHLVPEGTLGSAFHLQVKSCRPCNYRKAALENDISIITMLPDTTGKYARDDERMLRTVARKAKSAISPATHRLAAHSYNKIDARPPSVGGASLTYSGSRCRRSRTSAWRGLHSTTRRASFSSAPSIQVAATGGGFSRTGSSCSAR